MYLLVETGRDVRQVDGGVGPVAGQRRHADALLAVGVLVLRDELDAAAALLRDRRTVLVHHLQIALKNKTPFKRLSTTLRKRKTYGPGGWPFDSSLNDATELPR